MRIVRIDINNFRGIRQLKNYCPGERNVLVGPNNCGKTSILQALDYLLNPDLYFTDLTLRDLEFYRRDTSTPFTIEVWFGELSDEEWSFDAWDRMREYVSKDGETLSSIVTDNVVLRMRMEAVVRDGTMHVRHFYPKPEAEQQSISREAKSRVGFRYIRGDREPSKQLAFYQNSVFSRLVESRGLDAELRRVRSKLDEAGSILKSNERLKEVFSRLEKDLRDLHLLEPEAGALDLNVLSLSRRRLLQSFDFVIDERSDGTGIPLLFQGLGIQNAVLVLAFLHYIEEATTENLILAIEEPEQSMEPALQRALCLRLSRLLTPRSQLFITTHSPEVAKYFPLNDLSLVRRTDAHDVMKVGSIPAFRSDAKLLRQIEALWHDEFMRCLFARTVVFTEGASDVGAIPVFLDAAAEGELGRTIVGIEVVRPCAPDQDSAGITDISRLSGILKDLGIPTVALVDSGKKDASVLKSLAAQTRWVITWPKGMELEKAIVASFGKESVAVALDEWMKTVGGVALNKQDSDADVVASLSRHCKSTRPARALMRALVKSRGMETLGAPFCHLLPVLEVLGRSSASEAPGELKSKEGRVLATRGEPRNVYALCDSIR